MPSLRSLWPLLLLSPFVFSPVSHAHGSHGAGGEETLEAGEFDFTPIITIEGHGGFDTNLEGDPKHYAIDGLFGGVFEWGLGNGSTFAIEAGLGPALVWGEAEHFYGKVHVHGDHSDHDEHSDHDDHSDHDEHSEHAHHDEDEHHEDHGHERHDHERRANPRNRARKGNRDHHSDHDHDHDHDHDNERARRRLRQLAKRDRRLARNRADDHHDEHDHADHAHDEHHHEEHAHEHNDHHDHSAHGHNTDFKRSDLRGYLQARYAPNDRLSFSVSWNPYYVTKDQDDDIQGLKNELGANVTWALGDGDVNFGLGDGLEDLVNGVYLSLDHRQGWESDGMWVGDYTYPRVGLGFKFGKDEISLMIEAGPRFYTPGSYSGLNQRTDFAGEIELSVPVGDALLFVHWQQTYSWVDAPGWGEGWQHHVGTGVTFQF